LRRVSRISRRTAVAAALALLSASARASADDAKTTAEALFQEARQLIESGRWDDACPKLAASLKLDPSANGTRLNLARCQAKTGRVASAWTTARETVAEARRTNDMKRAVAAEEIVGEVEPLLPKLVIRVAPQANAASVNVLRDGVRIETPAWGVPVPVDPGEHIVSAEASGKQRWSTTTRADVKQTVEVTVPVLRDAPVSTQPAPGARAPAVEATEPRAEGTSVQRVVALTVAGVGIVGLGIGTVYGLGARSSWNDSQRTCVSDVCDPEGHRLAEEASAQATVSTIAFTAGTVLLIGGIVLWITASSRPSPTRSGAVH
jgi:hypothetical protein